MTLVCGDCEMELSYTLCVEHTHQFRSELPKMRHFPEDLPCSWGGLRVARITTDLGDEVIVGSLTEGVFSRGELVDFKFTPVSTDWEDGIMTVNVSAKYTGLAVPPYIFEEDTPESPHT